MYLWISPDTNQAAADAIAAKYAGLYFVFYSGPNPGGPVAALAGNNVKLGQCQLSSPPTNAADANGVITFNFISPDPSTDAVGESTFVRICNPDGSNSKFQGDVGTANTFCILNTTAFTVGGSVTIQAAAMQHHDGV